MLDLRVMMFADAAFAWGRTELQGDGGSTRGVWVCWKLRGSLQISDSTYCGRVAHGDLVMATLQQH